MLALHHTNPPRCVHLPASADTVGGRFHAALATGPLRYKLGFDAYQLRQNATQTIGDRDTGDGHHDRRQAEDQTMRKLKIVGWSLALTVASVAAVAAHMAVQKTMPEADAVLSESPQHIQMWFTQSPDPAISRLTLEGAGGAVGLGETEVRDDRSLVAMLPSKLGAGAYTVRWRTAGDDGHTQRGEFAFTVRAAD